jgi:hypothetical protein
MLAGRAVIVPGRVNRFIRFASRLVPRAFVMAVITRRWNTQEAGQAPREHRLGRKPAGWALAGR